LFPTPIKTCLVSLIKTIKVIGCFIPRSITRP
jgi:hypothetical protein